MFGLIIFFCVCAGISIATALHICLSYIFDAKLAKANKGK